MGGTFPVRALRLKTPLRSFEGPTLERVDDRFEYGETRVYTIGTVNGIEITAIYIDDAPAEHRIISAWRAERHEREAYWKVFG